MLATLELNLFILVTCFTVFPVVNACGQLQPGREKSINFAVTNFKLPAAMVYYEDQMAKMKVPTISTSKTEAEAFVRKLIMQSVVDVLYQQGRSALLPDNVISSILQQLDIEVPYEPLRCENVVTTPNMQGMNGAVEKKLNCIIVGDTVTNTCMDATMNAPNCMVAMMLKNFEPIEPKYLSILGSIKTSNAIMANWSNQMWENVLNRVLRTIASGPNGSYFFGASVTLR